MHVWLDKKHLEHVTTYKAASALVLARWEGKASSAFYRDPKAGIIEDDEGKAIAHVSYNGRVWATADRMTTHAEEIEL